ncbi:MAG: MOSC domain-containing protein [Rhodospirillaceae bacterium]|jgi:uncharacterized protein|nr:MOSC domain-containing protein [Rhodospirillaceae bacterium]MBT6206258.1 MOSC domain-containing protein [Rhodospirillaceae bacterium]MBT6509827.1 MOSC domain-containing protein [Rhodospirillaceae bacterium]MBT7614495.1 MOSC domain-containing protein [Rhodospirillaceae bacterium]MBT7647916.1 MOSC domain-containing protein [Rhodospirillaceae bacterium]
MKVGTIDSVWRYPVKDMRGEEVPHIYTAYTGLMGDRNFGVVAADGSPGHPWHTGRNQEEFLLYNACYQASEDLLLPLNLDATYSEWEPGIDPIYPDADAFKVTVETPEGVIYEDIENSTFIEDLEKITGRSLRVHMTHRGQFDARPVSLFSLSAAARLGEELGMTMDKRRFRANFYVEWDDPDDPFFEQSLIGKTLKIGDYLEMMIVERDERCMMITPDPDTAEPTQKLLSHLARKHGGNAGVFGAVINRGRVNKGDHVYLA